MQDAREKDMQKIVELKDSSDDKLFQSYFHSLVGESTMKYSKWEACMNKSIISNFTKITKNIFFFFFFLGETSLTP